eukprot:23517-Pyramimonas_sp.AAC.1
MSVRVPPVGPLLGLFWGCLESSQRPLVPSWGRVLEPPLGPSWTLRKPKSRICENYSFFSR